MRLFPRGATAALAAALVLCNGPVDADPAPDTKVWSGDAGARPRLPMSDNLQERTIGLPNARDSRLLLSSSDLTVSKALRVLVFAPHPDDETLGAGGLIQRVRAKGGTVRVVFITNGDGYVDGVQRDMHRANTSTADFIEYGERRHQEALRALAETGLKASDGIFLGFPDGGIDDLWAGHWSDDRPYISPHTRFDRPPYKESLSRRVEYAGSDLEIELARTLREFRPDWVITPDPRDRHPDHCTTGVFVLDALRRLRQTNEPAFGPVQVYSYLVHYPDYPASPAWVKEIAGAGVGGSPTAGRVLSAAPWVTLPLTASEVAIKRRAMSAYQSQVRVMNPFLEQFVRPFELFAHLNASQVTTVPTEYAARFRRVR